MKARCGRRLGGEKHRERAQRVPGSRLDVGRHCAGNSRLDALRGKTPSYGRFRVAGDRVDEFVGVSAAQGISVTGRPRRG
jgi:hypothetical protein